KPASSWPGCAGCGASASRAGGRSRSTTCSMLTSGGASPLPRGETPPGRGGGWSPRREAGPRGPPGERPRPPGGAGPVVQAGPVDFDDLIQPVVGPDHPTCRGIVHLWNLDAPTPDSLDAESLRSSQDAGLLSVIELIQAWDRAASDRSARLFLVTRG